MELRKGYKQTEVGVIPDNWAIFRLGDFTILKNGYAFSSSYFSKNGVIIITPGNFKLDGGLNFTERNTLRYKGEYTKEMSFQNGDLLMVMTDLTPDCNLLGKSGIVNSNEIILHNQRIGKIITNNNEVNKTYLLYYFNSSIYSNRMKSTATGSTVRHTSVPTIVNTILALPPFNEQTNIASALSDMDELIAQTDKLIKKKKVIKQGVMQELLKPKIGWETKKLGTIASFHKGKGLPKSHLNEYGKYKCVHYGELFTKYKERITNILSYTDVNINHFYSVSNDVLMPTSDVTPNGLATASCIKEDGVILGGDVLVIRVQPSILDGIFLSYFITQNREQIMKLVSGSTVYHLYGSNMKNFEVSFPNIVDQINSTAIISDLDLEIELLEEKNNKLSKQKQGMMQSLLTGKIRIYNHEQ